MSELEISLMGFCDLPPQPEVLSVDDIPDDQGGQVRVTFSRSKFDGIDEKNCRTSKACRLIILAFTLFDYNSQRSPEKP